MSIIDFAIPSGMEAEDVARAFTAYRTGGSDVSMSEEFPRLKKNGWWDVDNTNDYWVSINGTVGKLNYRYDSQEDLAQAMVQLFKLSHPPRARDRKVA